MKSLEELWTKSSLEEDVKVLSNPNVRHDYGRGKVDELVMNTVAKYLARYLDLASHDVSGFRDQVKGILERKDRMAFEFDQKEGIQYDAVYGKPTPGNDAYPIRCAADLHRTAAVFKEVAFGGNFVNNGRFIGLDLGSGTGVLTLAMAVAAARRKIKDFYCVGFERSGMAAKRSQETLESVVGKDHVAVFCRDVRDRNNYSELFKKPIHYWVSETISINTPRLDLRRRNFGLDGDMALLRRIDQGSDPFVEALRVSMDELPLFKPYVLKRATAMFPDILNGLYRPDRGRSTLALQTASSQNPVILEQVGRDFEGYGDLDLGWKRWHSPEELERVAYRKEE